jgi:hypothetical protein
MASKEIEKENTEKRIVAQANWFVDYFNRQLRKIQEEYNAS